MTHSFKYHSACFKALSEGTVLSIYGTYIMPLQDNYSDDLPTPTKALPKRTALSSL